MDREVIGGMGESDGIGAHWGDEGGLRGGKWRKLGRTGRCEIVLVGIREEQASSHARDVLVGRNAKQKRESGLGGRHKTKQKNAIWGENMGAESDKTRTVRERHREGVLTHRQ